jgi:response regulator NasT
VVILTAFSQRNLIEQARDAGVLSYLVKPFQRAELVSAIEVALGRFDEMVKLEETVKELEGQLESRKMVDRAKGKLMDQYQMSENEAFVFVQKQAMNDRSTMLVVAQSVLDGSLVPEA